MTPCTVIPRSEGKSLSDVGISTKRTLTYYAQTPQIVTPFTAIAVTVSQ